MNETNTIMSHIFKCFMTFQAVMTSQFIVGSSCSSCIVGRLPYLARNEPHLMLKVHSLEKMSAAMVTNPPSPSPSPCYRLRIVVL